MKPASDYHIHVYFDPEQQTAARRLRGELHRRYALSVGSVHAQPVGPHPKGMFQALLGRAQFGEVVSWLMVNRDGLDVLVHPDTGNDLRDHSELMLWLGRPVPLDLAALSATV